MGLSFADFKTSSYVTSYNAWLNKIQGLSTLPAVDNAPVIGSIDPTVPTIALSSSAASVNEGAGVTYTVTLSSAAPVGGLNVAYALTGTATNVTDYTGTTGTIAVAAGALTGTVTITTVADLHTEGAETIINTITAPTGYALTGTGTTTTTINDTSVDAVTPGDTTQAVNATTAAAALSAALSNVTYTVANEVYTQEITGFAAGDILDFPATNDPTVVNNSYTDNAVDVQFAFGGTITTIHLTGLADGLDMQLNGVSEFNTVFGAGTII